MSQHRVGRRDEPSICPSKTIKDPFFFIRHTFEDACVSCSRVRHLGPRTTKKDPDHLSVSKYLYAWRWGLCASFSEKKVYMLHFRKSNANVGRRYENLIFIKVYGLTAVPPVAAEAAMRTDDLLQGLIIRRQFRRVQIKYASMELC